MAVNLEPASGSGQSLVRADRRNADARQDHWMLEFEKAFVRGSELEPTLPKDPRVEPPNPAQVSAVSRTGLNTKLQGASAPRPADAPADYEARPALLRHADAGQRTFDAGSAPAVGAVPSAAGITTSNGAAMGVQGAGAGVQVRATTAGAAMAEVGTVASLSGVPGRLPVPGPSMAAVQLAAYGAVVPEALALPGSHGESAGRPLDGTPFEKQAMHVFVDSQGVHAFIRDTSLQATQLRAVIQAMSAEVAANGRQLATLTVNGKPVVTRAANTDGREDETVLAFHADGESAAAPSYFVQPASKGNP